MEGSRRFVGVGIDEYESAELQPLDYAVTDVEAVWQLLQPAFVGGPICNKEAQDALEHLKSLKHADAEVLV